MTRVPGLIKSGRMSTSRLTGNAQIGSWRRPPPGADESGEAGDRPSTLAAPGVPLDRDTDAE
jgi:hypothetical protein